MIVRWAAGFVNGGAGGAFVTYEQIHPHDAFGQVTKPCGSSSLRLASSCALHRAVHASNTIRAAAAAVAF